MSDYKALAAKHLDKPSDTFMVFRIAGDQAVVVVDNGIAGCPKYIIPLSILDALVEPEPEPEGETYIYNLPYRELQAIAKEYGVTANQKHDALVAELEAVFALEGEEE